jgi:hypothetical protein
MLFFKNYDAQKGINECISCVNHLQIGILKFVQRNFNGLDASIITRTCSMVLCEVRKNSRQKTWTEEHTVCMAHG